MFEVRDESGKLILTIHDSEAFLQLLDEYEKNMVIYSFVHSPFFKHMNLIIDQKGLEKIISAGEELQKIREKLGDNRENLYPVEIPK